MWNLFLPTESGISQLDYAGIAEISGWNLDLASAAINGQAPDTGNREVLHLFGTSEQKDRWLKPMLDASIRSAFAMLQPQVASSHAANIETEIARDGDEGDQRTKVGASGAADPRCELIIVMGKTDPGAARHREPSMVLVPLHTDGVTVVRRRAFNPITRGLMAEPGFPTPEEAISRSVASDEMSSWRTNWYLVFARFKLAVILEQIRVRHEAGNTLGDGFDQLAPPWTDFSPRRSNRPVSRRH